MFTRFNESCTGFVQVEIKIVTLFLLFSPGLEVPKMFQISLLTLHTLFGNPNSALIRVKESHVLCTSAFKIDDWRGPWLQNLHLNKRILYWSFNLVPPALGAVKWHVLSHLTKIGSCFFISLMAPNYCVSGNEVELLLYLIKYNLYQFSHAKRRTNQQLYTYKHYFETC